MRGPQFLDDWDNDPNVLRTRAVLEEHARRWAQAAVERPKAADPTPKPPEPSTRDRIAAAAARVRSGDVSAVALLRELLARSSS